MPHQGYNVFMYQEELDFLKWLVQQKPAIETGGDLFGLWQDDDTAVVQLILGPGKECSRTTTSFHQDVNYLGNVGRFLTSSQGLCNIGEWHSHHRIGLAEPSTGDKKTVWSHMSDVAGGRFLVFIANIEGSTKTPTVNVGCFVFNAAEGKAFGGTIISLTQPSPLREALSKEYLNPGAEEGQDYDTFKPGKLRKFLRWLWKFFCRYCCCCCPCDKKNSSSSNARGSNSCENDSEASEETHLLPENSNKW